MEITIWQLSLGNGGDNDGSQSVTGQVEIPREEIQKYSNTDWLTRERGTDKLGKLDGGKLQ